MKPRKRKLRVGLLFGGRSAEHEVSVASARAVYEALDRRKYEVALIGISRSGRWMLGSADRLLSLGTLPNRATVTLLPDPTTRGLTGLAKLQAGPRLDVILPILHGTYGEDGTIQGLFDLAAIPYVGSGVLGSSVGMDKVLQKQLFRASGLPVAPFIWFREYEWERKPKDILRQITSQLRAPYFVKPVNAGSSIGITKVSQASGLASAIRTALIYDEKIIVESGIPRPREFDCAILGNDAPIASGVAEIIPKADFYDYQAKYADNATEILIPATITVKLRREIQQLSLEAFRIVNAYGLARVEFLYGQGKLYLSEVNTLPGFTSHSIYPRLWAAEGLTYSALLDRLIQLALERAARRGRRSVDYRPRHSDQARS